MVIKKNHPLLTKKDWYNSVFNGDIISDKDLAINAALHTFVNGQVKINGNLTIYGGGLTVRGNLEVNGNILCGNNLLVDGHIKARGFINAVGLINAKYGIESGGFIRADGYIGSGTSIIAKDYIKAKGTIGANMNIVSGGCITSNSGKIKCGGYISANGDIVCINLDWYRPEDGGEDGEILCQGIKQGNILFGKLMNYEGE